MKRSQLAAVLAAVAMTVGACDFSPGTGTTEAPPTTGTTLVPTTLSPTTVTASPDSTALPPSADDPVLTVDLTGGCFMGGANCPRYVLYGDGSFALFRLGTADEPLPEEQGTIDPSLARNIHTLSHQLDFTGLRQSLGPGACNGCVDGIDTTLVFATGGPPQTFSSVNEELDPDQPLFAAAFAALAAMQAQAELVFQSPE